MPGAPPAGAVGRLRSRGDLGHVLPEGGKRCCPLLHCKKSFAAFGNFVEESIDLCFFYFKLRRREGIRTELFTGSAVLEGTQRCNSRPGFGRINTKERRTRDAGSHRSVAPSSCPSNESGSPHQPLASAGASLKRAWVGTSSQAPGQGGGSFRGAL